MSVKHFGVTLSIAQNYKILIGMLYLHVNQKSVDDDDANIQIL